MLLFIGTVCLAGFTLAGAAALLICRNPRASARVKGAIETVALPLTIGLLAFGVAAVIDYLVTLSNATFSLLELSLALVVAVLTLQLLAVLRIPKRLAAYRALADRAIPPSASVVRLDAVRPSAANGPHADRRPPRVA